MTKDEVNALLERIPSWPEDRQQELAEVALEIEAELAGAAYHATPDELAAIDAKSSPGKPQARRKSKRPSLFRKR
jgi:hypothetical protein